MIKIRLEGKECTKCNIYKEVDNYNKCTRAKDGFSHYCKKCLSYLRKKSPYITIQAIDNKKPCSVCREWLDISNFRKNKTLRCGLHSQCNKCECKGRNAHRKTFVAIGVNVQKKENILKFGITVEDYLNMIKVQDNKCAICNKEESTINPKTGKVKTLSIDHCHSTGKIRELLCGHCNRGLGSFRDDLEIMKKAILYLEKHKNEEKE